MKAAFNWAQVMLGGSAAVVVTRLFGIDGHGPVAELCVAVLGVLTFFVTTSLLLTGIITATSSTSFRAALVDGVDLAALVLAAGCVAAAPVALAARTFGTRLGLGVAAAGAVLLRAYGPELLTQPWNPYAPLLPFFLFVVACWTAATGRHRHLPVAVLAGSYCVQCHVGYAPAAVLGIVASVLGLLWHARADDRAPDRSTPRPTWVPSGRARSTACRWLPSARSAWRPGRRPGRDSRPTLRQRPRLAPTG